MGTVCFIGENDAIQIQCQGFVTVGFFLCFFIIIIIIVVFIYLLLFLVALGQGVFEFCCCFALGQKMLLFYMQTLCLPHSRRSFLVKI